MTWPRPHPDTPAALMIADYNGWLVINGRRYKGRQFNQYGGVIEVYRVGVLAAALNKSTWTIQKWELRGWLPQPRYAVRGEKPVNTRRWYTREQIVNLHRLIQLIPYNRGGQAKLGKRFFRGVRQLWPLRQIVNFTLADVDTWKGDDADDRRDAQPAAETHDPHAGRRAAGNSLGRTSGTGRPVLALGRPADDPRKEIHPKRRDHEREREIYNPAYRPVAAHTGSGHSRSDRKGTRHEG